MAWQDLKQYYVYLYLNKDYMPYYIGMGKQHRIISNHKYVDVPSWDNIAVIDDLSIEEAWDLETKLIDSYGMQINNTGILENLRRGGKTSNSDWYHSQQAKTKISEGNLGKVRTEEHKANYRGPKTAEHAENIRLANIGRKPDGRQKKGAIKMREYKWFNNGKLAKMFKPGSESSDFVLGRKLKQEVEV